MATATTPLYQCFNCKFRWEDEAGMVSCPRCGSIYALWLNHEHWTDPRRDRGKEKEKVK